MTLDEVKTKNDVELTVEELQELIAEATTRVITKGDPLTSFEIGKSSEDRFNLVYNFRFTGYAETAVKIKKR